MFRQYKHGIAYMNAGAVHPHFRVSSPTIFHGEMEFFQNFEPPALLSDWLRRSSEPLQSCVICLDCVRPSQMVLLELFQDENAS